MAESKLMELIELIQSISEHQYNEMLEIARDKCDDEMIGVLTTLRTCDKFKMHKLRTIVGLFLEQRITEGEFLEHIDGLRKKE